MDEFRKAGCHIVPVDGKSYMLRPAIIARQLEIPLFVIFDGDADCDDKYKTHHVKDNTALLKLLGGDETVPLPTDTVWTGNFTMWRTNLGQTVDSEIGASLGEEQFEKLKNKAHALYGNAKNIHKNPLLIGAKLALALDDGAKSESLDKLCDRILEFGRG
jgi:hypothetical protein